ncbi:ABC transporter ATP-binding protein [Sphingomonas sp. MMS24-JH45]
MQDALDAVGLGDLAEVPVRLLSTGQRRRAALARVVMAGADLWLLDEPATRTRCRGGGHAGDAGRRASCKRRDRGGGDAPSRSRCPMRPRYGCEPPLLGCTVTPAPCRGPPHRELAGRTDEVATWMPGPARHDGGAA